MQRNSGRTEDWGTWWGRLGCLSRGEQGEDGGGNGGGGGGVVPQLPSRRRGGRGEVRRRGRCAETCAVSQNTMKTFTMLLCLLDTKSHKVECSSHLQGFSCYQSSNPFPKIGPDAGVREVCMGSSAGRHQHLKTPYWQLWVVFISIEKHSMKIAKGLTYSQFGCKL